MLLLKQWGQETPSVTSKPASSLTNKVWQTDLHKGGEVPECFTDVSTCEAHSGAISVFEFAVLMRLPCLLETLDVANHASGRSMGQAMGPCLRRQLPSAGSCELWWGPIKRSP